METVERTYTANINNLHDVLAFLEEELEKHEANMKIINIMSISLEEMYANVCMYAYPDNDKRSCTIRISFDGRFVNVTLIDDGIPFDPLAKEDPNIHATAEERGIGGLGIYMVKEYMDECLYERTDNKNIFTMRKIYK